jgi:hypothetical protein
MSQSGGVLVANRCRRHATRSVLVLCCLADQNVQKTPNKFELSLTLCTATKNMPENEASIERKHFGFFLNKKVNDWRTGKRFAQQRHERQRTQRRLWDEKTNCLFCSFAAHKFHLFFQQLIEN